MFLECSLNVPGRWVRARLAHAGEPEPAGGGHGAGAGVLPEGGQGGARGACKGEMLRHVGPPPRHPRPGGRRPRHVSHYYYY
jgi:hypothetical protein